MILVFGKTGQVSQELRKNKDILCLNRMQADLSDPLSCHKAIVKYNPTAVINAAAYTAVDRAEEEEDLANVINGEAPSAMAKTCAKINIPLVHISTDYVFDGEKGSVWQTSDTTNPQNAYGRSKLKGEKAIVASGCTYAILRTSWVISPYGTNFVKAMLSLSETKDRLTVVDDQIGGPTCARDIAQACKIIAQILINRPEKSGIYHFSGTPDVSWSDFAKIIFEQAGRKTAVTPIKTVEYPTPALRPRNSRLNCKSTESTFNIPRPKWCEGLKDILRDLGISHETT